MLRRYPSLLLLEFVLAGVLIADISRWPALLFLLSALAFVLAGLIALARTYLRASVLIFAAAFAAIAAAQFSRSVYDYPARHISNVISDRKAHQLFGRVADWPDLKSSYTEILMAVDSIGDSLSRRTTGLILLKITDTTTELQRGDRIEFYGRIYPVVQGASIQRFDYGRYLSLKGVAGVVYLPTLLDVRIDKRNQFGFYSVIDKLRDAIRAILYADLSPQSAALAAGFLIGETRDIPGAVYQSFRNSGTLHLMAVSGSNVAIVIAFFYLLLQPFRFSRVQRTMALLVVVICFTALSYGEPSVLRASVMATIVMCAGLTERKYDLNNVIALAMLVILLVQPTQLYDVGFQLSFATAWGLIFFLPKLTLLFKKHHDSRWYKWLVFPLLVSAVAQICSTPLIAYYFERIPLISLGANLCIVPLASVALVGILGVLVAHVILPVLGTLCGRFVDLLLVVTLRLVNLFGGEGLPSINLTQTPPPAVFWLTTALFYTLLIVALLSIQSKRARRVLAVTLLLAVNAAIVAALAQDRPASGSTIHLITVPGGVAGLVTGAHSPGADLIITDLVAKPYDLGEKILHPWLREHEAEKLDRIFVLLTSYQAVDDLLRLAESTKVEHLYVSSACARSFRDVIADIAWPDSLARKVQFFGGSAGQHSEAGYWLGKDRIDLLWRGGEVAFMSNIPERQTRPPKYQSTRMLVLSKPWKAIADDWIAARAAGCSDIVCPRIAQPVDRNELPGPDGPDWEPPDYVHQLQKTGELDIDLSLSPQIVAR